MLSGAGVVVGAGDLVCHGIVEAVVTGNIEADGIYAAAWAGEIVGVGDTLAIGVGATMTAGRCAVVSAGKIDGIDVDVAEGACDTVSVGIGVAAAVGEGGTASTGEIVGIAVTMAVGTGER